MDAPRTDRGEFERHLRTFASVFPHVMVARGPGGYGNFFLGSMTPIELTDAGIRDVLERPGVLEDISSAYDSPETTLEGWAALIPELVTCPRPVWPFVPATARWSPTTGRCPSTSCSGGCSTGADDRLTGSIAPTLRIDG